MNPCIAIIDRNTLSNITLRSILWDLYNKVEVFVYSSMDAFIRDSNRHFIHFFVSSEILFTHVDEFELLKNQTTVLSPGPDRRFEDAGHVHILGGNLTVCSKLTGKLLTECSIFSDELLHIQLISRYEPQQPESMRSRRNIGNDLSQREKEVLRFIIKGHTNKEMASMLDISLTTVIFHRNNICEKLGTRSIGRMTIYAVLSGLVEINDI